MMGCEDFNILPLVGDTLPSAFHCTSSSSSRNFVGNSTGFLMWDGHRSSTQTGDQMLHLHKNECKNKSNDKHHE
eukprot:5484155-Amphidinium_carterae.1